MKITFLFLLLFLSLNIYGQDSPTEQSQPIVAEGKQLYRSEMASWYGTDLFLEKYKDRANVGGYFSYPDNNIAKCIFFSKSANPKVIGTITFDSTYNTQTANIDLGERDFTSQETQLYTIRKTALDIIQTDTLFKKYTKTNLNLIPLINGNEKKVYVITGPEETGVVIFGNDYLLTFDKDNALITKKQLHKNIIPINYGKDEKGNIIERAVHTHLPETGEFITATDICTLMLYERFANWSQHTVVSEKYVNIWNCRRDELVVLTKDVIDKINKDQEKREKKKNK